MNSVASRMLGEVIVASTTEFTAQSLQLHEPPDFGSFVKVEMLNLGEGASQDPFEKTTANDGTIYGLVYKVSTGSIEANRRPAAYGLDEHALKAQQPQIFELLATDFSCLLIGHVQDRTIRGFLPPVPPNIHAQVTPCADWEIQALTDRLDYLRTLMSASSPSPDELIAASLRHAFKARGSDEAFLVRAGKEVATLLHDDYGRVDAILRRITP